jgi:hypothetical protein
MNILRRLPTSQLIGLLAGAVLLAGSITAGAMAALGGGPVPSAKPLAAAIHDALAARPVAGVSARISFTNQLIDSSSLGSENPLLNGASGRLWASHDGHVRLELQSRRGDTEILLAPDSFSLYDTASNTIYEGTLPAHRTHASHGREVPSVGTIQSDLDKLTAHVKLSGAVPSDVAGAPAYTVSVSPKRSGGLLRSAALAWDAVNGVPLRVAIYAAGSSSPVLELSATDISFGPVPRGDFALSPPAGVKVVKISQLRTLRGAGRGARAVSGAPLIAPARLAGRARASVRTLGTANRKASVVTYGRDLGAIVVLERAAGASGGSHLTASLPSVHINGVRATELATALGTVLEFERQGVSYLVAGSVRAAVAEAAARGL